MRALLEQFDADSVWDGIALRHLLDQDYPDRRSGRPPKVAHPYAHPHAHPHARPHARPQWSGWFPYEFFQATVTVPLSSFVIVRYEMENKGSMLGATRCGTVWEG